MTIIYPKGYVTWTKKNTRIVYCLDAHRYEIEIENSTVYMRVGVQYQLSIYFQLQTGFLILTHHHFSKKKKLNTIKNLLEIIKTVCGKKVGRGVGVFKSRKKLETFKLHARIHKFFSRGGSEG